MESKTIVLRRKLSIALLAGAAVWLSAALTSAQQPNNAAAIQNGRRIFSGSCSMGYCHGAEGIGGGGPKLRDRKFSVGYLTKVITDGVPDTTMPGFKTNLTAEQIANVVAYVQTLAPKGSAPAQNNEQLDPHLRGDAPKPEAPKAAPKAVATETPKPKLAVSSEIDLQGDAVAGRDLFFDLAKTDSCRVCHTFNGKGGKVGPDLAALASRPPREILQGIVSPHTTISENFVSLALTTKDGQRYVGVKRDEDETMIRLFDVSTLPPISRAFLKTDISKTETLKTSAMPADYGTKLSLKQLLDLVSFLKTTDAAQPVSIRLKELFN